MPLSSPSSGRPIILVLYKFTEREVCMVPTGSWKKSSTSNSPAYGKGLPHFLVHKKVLVPVLALHLHHLPPNQGDNGQRTSGAGCAGEGRRMRQRPPWVSMKLNVPGPSKFGMRSLIPWTLFSVTKGPVFQGETRLQRVILRSPTESVLVEVDASDRCFHRRSFDSDGF